MTTQRAIKSDKDVIDDSGAMVWMSAIPCHSVEQAVGSTGVTGGRLRTISAHHILGMHQMEIVVFSAVTSDNFVDPEIGSGPDG